MFVPPEKRNLQISAVLSKESRLARQPCILVIHYCKLLFRLSDYLASMQILINKKLSYKMSVHCAELKSQSPNTGTSGFKSCRTPSSFRAESIILTHQDVLKQH